jgi:CBS domain-containing protein
MQYAPLTGRPEDLVSQAQQRMHRADVRHLPIVAADGTLLGLLSDRDLRQAGASTLPPLSRYDTPVQLMTMLVKDVMHLDVTTVSGETTLADAGQLLLEHKIGCLPVLHHDRTLVGMVTVTDLLRAYVAVEHPGTATLEEARRRSRASAARRRQGAVREKEKPSGLEKGARDRPR